MFFDDFCRTSNEILRFSLFLNDFCSTSNEILRFVMFFNDFWYTSNEILTFSQLFMTFAIRLMKYEDLWRIVECSEHGGIHSSPQLEMPRWPWQGSFKRVRATRPPQKNYIHKLPINRKAAGASIIYMGGWWARCHGGWF